nr:hypothetical protein [Lysobacter pythonis]
MSLALVDGFSIGMGDGLLEVGEDYVMPVAHRGGQVLGCRRWFGGILACHFARAAAVADVISDRGLTERSP